MKKSILSLCALTMCTILSAPEATESQHTEKPTQNQQTVYHFFGLPEFTPSSFGSFIEKTYNHRDYATRFLAVNINYHLPHFYRFAQQCPLPRTYLEATTSLFNQKLKASTYLNGYSLCDFLQALPELLGPYCEPATEKQERVAIIKKCLHDFLLDHFEELKDQPDKALTDAAELVYQHLQPGQNTDISIAKLQHGMLLFLDHALHKTIWSPRDQQEVWQCVKDISQHLETLLHRNIIADVESLDDLYWTLINRFCYFLDVAGHDLNETCYQRMSMDLAQHKLALWELAEREPFVTPKRKHLEDALLQADATRRAYQAGIMKLAL